MNKILILALLPILVFGDAGENAEFFGFWTLVPPAIAIILAFITKDVIFSLFIGAFSGTFMLALTGNGFFKSLILGYTGFIHKAVNALGSPGNAGIVLQVLCIGGVVALITKNGGTKAIALWLSKKAQNAKSAQFSTWIMGLIIFFDDYANSLIVGPIMRPVTDKFKVSREKLAFIMDATAAPVTGIAIISTWIGLEISVIKLGYDLIDPSYYQYLSVDVANLNAFEIFVQTIPYRFYNIFMIAFVIMTIFSAREFGPMLKAQRDAKLGIKNSIHDKLNSSEEESLLPLTHIKPQISNALVPLLVLIFGSFIGFYYSGYSALETEIVAQIDKAPLSFYAFRETFGAADASVVLFQAAIAAAIVAIIMGVIRKIFTVKEAIETWSQGWKTMITTIIILVLAWSLASAIKDLGTSVYLVELLSDKLPYFVLPALIFLLASIISFATGTSYGTMGILMPLAIPLSVAVGVSAGVESLHSFMIICISGVLTGAIFGDHCSPISDTTILSSMGSKCDHIAHVATQLPYAIFICIVSLLIGYIPATLGLNILLVLILGLGVSFGFLMLVGKKV
ncbi:MAG: Na+/H+ antiporter NhaC family protein [Campylobacter sp.]|nr:Na+/H+ antiporter NhaC family protein [Campylobacter sp.]